ncbi:MAG: hypothetical protein FJZ64_00070 [Chlamydiae bacterium]|nr:hypothetical protein [Chlamydiota bacterium]
MPQIIPLAFCPSAKDVKPKPLGKIGVVILAGGQGSRLGHIGPKGTFSIGGKSLFQWLVEKVFPSTPIAVMTSPLNHEETVSFFQKNHFFSRRVVFFEQNVEALLDETRKPLNVFIPDGNGSFFSSFERSGFLHQFEEEGVDLVSIIPVENVLADPEDPFFITYGREANAEVAVKCIERRPTDPPMGALVEKEGRIEILEYTEQPPFFSFRYAYVGMMAFQLSFMKQMAKIDLPLHWVWKKVEKQFGWKGERFIFDALSFSKKTVALCCPKEENYAALKTIENVDSILNNKKFSLMTKTNEVI